jgi:hypothetical protein
MAEEDLIGGNEIEDGPMSTKSCLIKLRRSRMKS